MTRIAQAFLALSLLALLSLGLGACASDNAANKVSSTVPMVGGDSVGSGGKMDEVYRQIYTPGDPNWSH